MNDIIDFDIRQGPHGLPTQSNGGLLCSMTTTSRERKGKFIQFRSHRRSRIDKQILTQNVLFICFGVNQMKFQWIFIYIRFDSMIIVSVKFDNKYKLYYAAVVAGRHRFFRPMSILQNWLVLNIIRFDLNCIWIAAILSNFTFYLFIYGRVFFVWPALYVPLPLAFTFRKLFAIVVVRGVSVSIQIHGTLGQRRLWCKRNRWLRLNAIVLLFFIRNATHLSVLTICQHQNEYFIGRTTGQINRQTDWQTDERIDKVQFKIDFYHAFDIIFVLFYGFTTCNSFTPLPPLWHSSNGHY